MKFVTLQTAVGAFVALFTWAQNAPAQDWTVASAPNAYWNSVACSADGSNVFAVGYSGGAFYTSQDSGMSWISNYLHTAAGGLTCIASSADGKKLVVGTVSDVLYTSTNAGATWRSNSVPVNTWKSVASSADGSRLVAASAGPIYTSADAGVTWVAREVPVTEDYPYFLWGGLASSADGTRLAAAGYMPMNYTLGHAGGLIYRSGDGGVTWQPSTAPNTNWCSIACSADGRVLIAAASEDTYDPFASAIFISTNFGSSWTIVDVPETRNLQRRVSVACSADGTRMVVAAVGFWTPGVILVSTNSGLSWSTNSSPSGTWSAVCSSADGGKLMAALYGGRIYTSSSSVQPTLSISASPGEAIVSWTVPSSEFTLQQSADLSPGSWTNVVGVSSTANYKNLMTIPRAGNLHFRLKSP